MRPEDLVLHSMHRKMFRFSDLLDPTLRKTNELHHEARYRKTDLNLTWLPVKLKNDELVSFRQGLACIMFGSIGKLRMM